VLQNGFNRAVEAVQVESVEAHFRSASRKRLVMSPQPLDEVEHDGVPPHPSWEAAEPRQRFIYALIAAAPANVKVGAMGIRPIGFGCNRIEALLFDQQARDAGPLTVKLMRPMRSFAQQDETSVADDLEQAIIIAADAAHGHSLATDDCDRIATGRHASRRIWKAS